MSAKTGAPLSFPSNERIWPNIYETMSLFLKPQAKDIETKTVPRTNQSALEEPMKKQFVDAMNNIIRNGQYADLVSIHSDARHRIHSESAPAPLNERFLPWHRVFLYELEVRLNIAAGGSSNIRIPYWDWTVDRDIPDWLRNFTPTLKNVPIFRERRFPDPPGPPQVVNTTINVKRYPGTWPDRRTGRPIELPTKAQIDEVLTQTTFFDFTGLLEGHHGIVHVWLGGTTRWPPTEESVGTMSDPEISPSDPCFWLHHSNIDRIWDLWHNAHTGGPNLQGTDAVMDPWSYRTDKDRIEDTKIFGYTYE